MNKKLFLERLEYLLSDLPEEEREEALLYYRDYFEEAGPEREKDAVQHFGSPEKVAAEIRAGFADGNPETESGEFTEHGYRDVRFEEISETPDQYTQVVRVEGAGREKTESAGEQECGRKSNRAFDRERNVCRNAETKDSSRNGLLILLLFVCFGLPLAGKIIGAGFSLIAALFGAVFGIFGGLFGLIAGAVGIAAGLFAAGIEMILSGMASLMHPVVGMMMIGTGFFAVAGGVLCVLLVKWGCTTAVPGVFRFISKMVRRVCDLIRSLVCRMFGKGRRQSMKRSTKRLLMLTLICVIIGASFCISSVCLGFSTAEFRKAAEAGQIKLAGPQEWQEELQGAAQDLLEERERFSEAFTGVRSLKIETDAVDCRLIPYEGKSWKVSGEAVSGGLKTVQSGDTLKITGRKKNWRVWNWGNPQEKLNIYIPENAEIDELKLQAGAGEIWMEDGYLNCGMLDLECGVGNCRLNLNIEKKAEIKCGVGDLTLHLIGAEEDFNYDIQCGIGDLTLGDQSRSGFGTDEKIDHHASKDMKLECGIGDVEIHFQKE